MLDKAEPVLTVCAYRADELVNQVNAIFVNLDAVEVIPILAPDQQPEGQLS